MDWRSWVYRELTSDPALLPPLLAGIYGAGSLNAPPKVKPFLVIKFDGDTHGAIRAVEVTRLTLWAHDDPGDYLRIGDVLSAAKLALCGDGERVAVPGAIACVWRGNSGDLSDPDYGTIVRNSSYDLVAKR